MLGGRQRCLDRDLSFQDLDFPEVGTLLLKYIAVACGIHRIARHANDFASFRNNNIHVNLQTEFSRHCESPSLTVGAKTHRLPDGTIARAGSKLQAGHFVFDGLSQFGGDSDRE